MAAPDKYQPDKQVADRRDSDSISYKVHRELDLLASVPHGIVLGIENRVETDITHKRAAGLEVAGSAALAAGLTFFGRRFGLSGDIARMLPKVFGTVAAADIGYRFGAPMLDTWNHPNHLALDKQWLGNGLGDAVIDYPLSALGGVLGGAFGSIAGRVAFAGSEHGLAAFPRLSVLGSMFNGPVVLGAEALQRYYDRGKYPPFPSTVPVPPIMAYHDLKPDHPADVIAPGGIDLTEKQPLQTFGINLSRRAPVRLDLQMSGPGTDWAKRGKESAVLSVYVDGRYSQDAVLYGGSENSKYTLSLNELPAGHHAITLRYADEKSTPNAKEIHIDSGTASGYSYDSREEEIIDRHSPILYGRNGIENNHNDVPLGMFHWEETNPDGSETINYGYVFSNEDAGTLNPPANGMSLLGRMTDIDEEYKVTVDKSGKVIDEQYHGQGDTWHTFHGRHEQQHPLLLVSTNNDNVTYGGEGPLKFQYLPESERSAPKEDIMRQHPLWWQTSAKEVTREGKVDTSGDGDPPTSSDGETAKYWARNYLIGEAARMADPRRYLYVQMNTQGTTVESPMAVRVILDNGKAYYSDWSKANVAMERDGWTQTSVLLPKGTAPSHIASVDFLPRGNGDARGVSFGHIFMLDDDYRPVDVDLP
jgi:hypothetical protein